MIYCRIVQSQRLVLLVIAMLLFFAIPFHTAFAQDPETTEQESSDRLIVATVVIILIAAYAAIFVGEDADSRGKDGVQWGIACFAIVCGAPVIYYFLAGGENDDKLLVGGGIFLAILVLTLSAYYMLLRPQRLKFS
jgi:hypothetical protein